MTELIDSRVRTSPVNKQNEILVSLVVEPAVLKYLPNASNDKFMKCISALLLSSLRNFSFGTFAFVPLSVDASSMKCNLPCRISVIFSDSSPQVLRNDSNVSSLGM